ncbi:YegP family protein [Flavilitoribacter nigricans]|uniref:DUF1508 domain-containing protein n=1 Tax=Flavilitoribacter nigricans (strain ATCC 23147 / DSM 23189 / NBRC 102662 / NCIMB 1420 / SS-2) TaxID=1122177 RepID=A0A2D0N0V8_FLAN2|nr:YegP family protein [Flavilitoribacter nigricans]PHN02182.1 hypothetical protein CRP01_33135 [Flavilitoribacter nigricans DSM 23189 = NBRC 102662]
MKNPKFQIYKDKSGQFRFRLKAGNGEVVLTGEAYTTKQGAQNGIESVQKNAANDTRYERKEAKNGEHYFVLKAANAQVIGMSEMYKSASGRNQGVQVIQKIAAGAPTEDQTV